MKKLIRYFIYSIAKFPMPKTFINFYNFYKHKISRKLFGVIHLKTKNKARGNVLFSYDTSPFLRLPGEDYFSHTNQWECKEIANIFLNRGYNVDVIDSRNVTFIPSKKYDFFIDVHQNLERIMPFLNKDCVKIFHITTKHWLFQNYVEYLRLLNLKKRRGIVLKPERILSATNSIDFADYVSYLGNQSTIETYDFSEKIIFPIPLSTTHLYPFSEGKDFEKCRKNFLWLGGGGLVLKGLDLVLEVFGRTPEYNLTICGPINPRGDFEKLYHRELYKTPNIKTISFIDLGSQKFSDIVNSSLSLIYPSASEGQAGSVIVSMHAGLIPIISYESGVDINDFGIILKKSSMEEIKKSIERISNLPALALKSMAKGAWEYARKNHTRERFSEEYNKFVDKILATKK